MHKKPLKRPLNKIKMSLNLAPNFKKLFTQFTGPSYSVMVPREKKLNVAMSPLLTRTAFSGKVTEAPETKRPLFLLSEVCLRLLFPLALQDSGHRQSVSLGA